MNIRSRTTRNAVVGVTAVAALTGLCATMSTASAATSAADPAFLAPGEMPPHATSSWTGGPVTAGRPDPLPMCVGEALPSTGRFREFWTDMDATGRQFTVVERDETRAKSLAALWSKDIAGCADKMKKEDPELIAGWEYFGKLNVEEGADVYGVYTEQPWGAADIHMFSVGRDGNTVTFVNWGQMGNFQNAQVDDFKKTTVTAVNKLY